MIQIYMQRKRQRII